MVRKLTAAALAILTAAAVAGCQGNENIAASPEVSASEESSVAETGETGTTAEKTSVALSQEELAQFTELFNSSAYNGFLMSEYEKPQEIDLEEAFYNGAGIKTEPLSVEEIEGLKKADAYFDTDCTKLTTAQIEDVLLKRTGYGLEDMEYPLTWTYLPEFDTYYFIHGDTNFKMLKCLEGTKAPDGSVEIRYEEDSGFYGTQGDLWQVRLVPSKGEWRLLSNVCLERTVTLYYPDAAAENFLKTEVRISGTPQSMVDGLIKLGALPEGSLVNHFETDGEGGAVLDMNQVYGKAINSTGITGERSLLGSLVNTFLQRYGLDHLTVTIDGEFPETGHAIYDSPMEFYTFI